MTVSTTSNTISYTGDASTVAFSFPYLFYVNSHLKVYVDDVLKTITTHYTVTGAENPAGGTVTFVTAPASAAEIIIQRVAPTTQETDLENFDGNPADVTEKQFDLLAMVDQQLTESIERSILAPLGTSLTSNAISGTITATNKVLLISTAGPVASALADLDTDLDVVLTNPADGDILRYDGANWVNIDGIPATLGAANTVLQVNAGGTANEYEKIKALNVDINAATDTVITASDEIWFGDATDSNLVKKDTVQGILDLVTAGGLVPIKTVTASNVASVDFVNGSGGVVLDGTYNAYVLIITDAVLASTGNSLGMRVSTDSGATWKNTSGDYYYAYDMVQSDSTANAPGVSKTATLLLVAIGAGGGANESVAGIVHIFNPADTTKPMKMSVRTAYENNGGELRSFTGDGKYTANTAVNGIRLLSSSGNVSLTATLYGLASA